MLQDVHNTFSFIKYEQGNIMNKMNQTEPLNAQIALIQRAVDAVVQNTPIRLRFIHGPTETSVVRSNDDLQATFDINGVLRKYDVEIKTGIKGRADLEAIAWRKAGLPVDTILVTAHMTLALAEECVRLKLQFIDLAGNIYLHASGQYIFIVGRSPNAEVKRLKSMAGQSVASASASALRMIFTFLCEPDLLNRPYREIASAAGVALGTIGPVLEDLRERRLISGADKRHGRRILDISGLREEWISNYPLRLRPKLNAQHFSAMDASWWQDVRIPSGKAWWGGEVAAAKLTGYLQPITQTLYVKPEERTDIILSFAKQHRLRADHAGSIEILDAFWEFGERDIFLQPTAPRLLVLADLLSSREARNLEVAALLRKEIEHDDANFS
jgi:hypothetical protein